MADADSGGDPAAPAPSADAGLEPGAPPPLTDPEALPPEAPEPSPAEEDTLEHPASTGDDAPVDPSLFAPASPEVAPPETPSPATSSPPPVAVPALAVVKVAAAPVEGSSSPAPDARSAVAGRQPGAKASRARTGARIAEHRTLEERFPPGNPCDIDFPPGSDACLDFVRGQDECRDSGSAACARAIDQLSSRACLDDPASVRCERLIADVQILCFPPPANKTSGGCGRLLGQIARFLPCLLEAEGAPGCAAFDATHLRLCNTYPQICGRGFGGSQEALGPRGAAPDRTVFASAADPGSRGDRGVTDEPPERRARAAAKPTGKLARTGSAPVLLALAGLLSVGGGVMLRRRLTTP